MKSDLINANQLKGVLASTSSSTEAYAKALETAIQVISEQPHVTCSDPSEIHVKEPNYPLDYTTAVSGTIHADFSNMSSQTIIALQCKSCGGVIDKDTMTCKHCGMAYMLVNSSEINPRLIYPDF